MSCSRRNSPLPHRGHASPSVKSEAGSAVPGLDALGLEGGRHPLHHRAARRAPRRSPRSRRPRWARPRSAGARCTSPGRFSIMLWMRSRPQCGIQRTRSISSRRGLAEPGVLEREEPLVGGAEDHRVVAAPAVRVAVLERGLRVGEQVARGVRGRPRSPGSPRRSSCPAYLPASAVKRPGAVHRVQDLEPVAQADLRSPPGRARARCARGRCRPRASRARRGSPATRGP